LRVRAGKKAPSPAAGVWVGGAGVWGTESEQIGQRLLAANARPQKSPFSISLGTEATAKGFQVSWL
jgi:hypothetical protein